MSEADDTLPAPDAPAPSSTASFAPGRHVAGRYRIVRFIASGAMGEVFEAEDLIVGGAVALKTVRPELERSPMAMERLRREIMLARKVTNAHICRLHDVGEHEGRVFITMELLAGETLSEVVGARGALPVDEVARIARQLVDGLAALHAHGIVHRDFKTSNVMLVGDRAVITDFGLARSIEPDAMASLTVEASMLGTPAYMAPEQVEGRPATPASDIYALGVVLFELLTGTVPFHEDTALATATARLTRDPPRPSSLRAGIPASWDARVRCCLARDPAQRFARVLDVLEAPVPRRASRSRRWFLAAAGAGLAGLGVGAWRLFGRDDGAAGPLAPGELVAVLPPARRGDADALALAIAVDLADALATAGVPVLALDGGALRPSLDGTAIRIAAGPDPVAAAFAVPGVAAVVTTTLAEPLVLAVTMQQRRGAGWTRRFARGETEAPLLVEEVAAAIATSLGDFTVRSAKDAAPIDLAAYRRYGTSLATENHHAPAPSLARALAAAADHHRSRELADRALAVDPDQAIALAARGRSALFAWDWKAADADTRRAVELAPTNARTTLTRAMFLHLANRFAEAIPLFEAAFARNPLAPAAIRTVGWAYYFGRQFQRGIDRLSSFAKDPAVASWLVLSQAEMSRFDAALAAAEQLRATTKDPDALATIVQAYVMAGRTADARAILDEVKATAEPYLVATALDAVGDVDGALVIFETIVGDRGDRAVYLAADRFSPSLRSSARFQALVARVGAP